jgi:hypothetical protein
MPPLSIEERVAALEQKVESLAQQAISDEPRKKDWRKAIGIFTDNPGMLEIFEEAMKIREADRAKARRGGRKPRRAKS